MSSFKFWQRPEGKASSNGKASGRRRRKGKISFEETALSFDLFYQLTYMSAISSAGISRDRLFRLSAQLPCPPSRYFKEVNDLVQLGYGYPEACRMIGESTEVEDVKAFLLRLSNSLSSGGPLADFLAREAEVQGERYTNAYERSLASMGKWVDAHSALVISTAVIVIINLVSTLIYEMGKHLMVILTAVAVMTSFFGAWAISRSAPREVRSLGPLWQGLESFREGHLSYRLLEALVPASLLTCLILAFQGVKLGWILVVASLFLFPLGLLTFLGDRKITRKEEEIGPFLRSLGGMATSTGTTLVEALDRLDFRSFPWLESDIKRLRLRLLAFVEPELCWRTFAAETGSKLISEAVSIFYDAVSMGGDPERVGYFSSLFAMKVIMLRAKRRVVSSTSEQLTTLMHGAVVVLMVFVVEVVIGFRNTVSALGVVKQAERAGQALSLPIPLLAYGGAYMQFLYQIVVVMILILTVTDAFALISADGGHVSKGSFYLSILMFVTGLSLLYVPSLVSMIM